MSLNFKLVRFAWFIPIVGAIVLMAGCASKPITRAEAHGISMEIKKCRRMKGDLECIFYVKTSGQKARFRILRDSPDQPVAKDDRDNGYVASEVYINGVGYLNKWVYMGAFKSMPGMIVFPNLDRKADAVAEINLTLVSDLVKDKWNNVFSNIQIK